MYSKIFELNSETFYNYKDRWKVDIKNDLYYGKTYTRSEIDNILNSFMINTLASRKNMTVQLRIVIYMFSNTNNIVDCWVKGRQPPQIFIACDYGKNPTFAQNTTVTLFSPQAFIFEAIRIFMKGNGKIYTDVGLIDLPVVEIHSNVVDHERLSYIDEWYEVVIASFNYKKEEIKELKRRYL